MKLSLPLVTLLLCTSLPAREESVSKAPDHNAEVIGIYSGAGDNSIRVVADKEILVEWGLAWGGADSSVVSWSPHSSKVAISLRTTKTSSVVSVFDLQTKKEVPLPDLEKLTLALNSEVKGRFSHLTPAGWVNDDTVILVASGNLMNGVSDGQDSVNYQYQITLHLPTKRIVAVTCLSQHDLNGLKK